MVSVFSVASAQELIDKVAAQIGGEYILLSDIEKQISYMSESQPSLPEDARCSVLESLIGQKLMVNQAKLDSIVVGAEEVDAQLDYRIQTILRQMNGNEELFESYYGQSVEEVRIWMRDDIRQMLLAERMQQSLVDRITITPSETKEFFESIPSDSLPYFNAEVEVAEIVILPEVNEVERQKALEKVEMIRENIVSEAYTFEEMAKKYSQDPGSKRLGGDLGTQRRGTFVPEFEAEAYSMKEGEISEPVETQFGFHIIQLLERRGNSIHTRHVLIKPEITQADIDKAIEKLAMVKNLVDSDSLTFTEALKKYGNEDQMSYNNLGRLTNPVNGTTFFETKDLSPDVYFAIEEMEVGDITEPLDYLNEANNETQYRIIKLISRTRPHKANLQDDYSKIQFYAKENKKNELFAEWIEERISNTYINVDKGFKQCPNIADLVEN